MQFAEPLLEDDVSPFHYPRSRIPSLEPPKAPRACPSAYLENPTLGIFPPDRAIAGSGTTSIPIVSVTISARRPAHVASWWTTSTRETKLS